MYDIVIYNNNGCGHCKTFYNITRPIYVWLWTYVQCKTFYNNKTNLCGKTFYNNQPIICMVVDIVKHFIITRPFYLCMVVDIVKHFIITRPIYV